MKLVTLNANPTMQEALEAVELLRKDVESGKVGAFFAIGVTAEDGVMGYTGSSRPHSRLRMQGAISQGLHDWLSGMVGA